MKCFRSTAVSSTSSSSKTSNDNEDAALVPMDTMHKPNMLPYSCIAEQTRHVVTSSATLKIMDKWESPNNGTSQSTKSTKNQCTGI